MPAHDFEVEEAEEEGVLMKWLSTIKQADGGKVVIEHMELDETGFPQPTGELEELEADALVLALGQETDLSLLEDVPGLEVEDSVVSGPNMMTGYPGIFAGGDMVPAERTVTVAVGHGKKKIARHIDAWLRGEEYSRPSKHELAAVEHLNTWYYSDAPRSVQPQLELARRESTFEEVVGGLDEATALYEARRCLSCGNCFSCDNCYGVCPDNAVIKLGAAGRRTGSTTTTARAAGSAPPVPVRCHRDGSRGDLKPVARSRLTRPGARSGIARVVVLRRPSRCLSRCRGVPERILRVTKEVGGDEDQGAHEREPDSGRAGDAASGCADPLAEHGVSGLPVIGERLEVLGVVSEADIPS